MPTGLTGLGPTGVQARYKNPQGFIKRTHPSLLSFFRDPGDLFKPTLLSRFLFALLRPESPKRQRSLEFCSPQLDLDIPSDLCSLLCPFSMLDSLCYLSSVALQLSPYRRPTLHVQPSSLEALDMQASRNRLTMTMRVCATTKRCSPSLGHKKVTGILLGRTIRW